VKVLGKESRADEPQGDDSADQQQDRHSTVNCSWSNTKLMVSNLCRMFGEPCVGDGEAFTFPTPERPKLAAYVRRTGRSPNTLLLKPGFPKYDPLQDRCEQLARHRDLRQLERHLLRVPLHLRIRCKNRTRNLNSCWPLPFPS
jgi:hypothetical protein